MAYESTQKEIQQKITVDLAFDVTAVKKLEAEIKSGDKTIQEGLDAIDKVLNKIQKTKEKSENSAKGRAAKKKNRANEAFATQKKQLKALTSQETQLLNVKKRLRGEEAKIEAQQKRNYKSELARRKEIQRRWDKRRKDRIAEDARQRKNAEARRKRIQREWNLRKRLRAEEAKKARVNKSKSTFGGALASNFTGGTGNIGAGIGGAIGTLGKYLIGGGALTVLLTGFKEIVRGITESIKLGVKFEAQLADLSAVAGITTSEVKELGEAAFQLAGSTKFSVDEIVSLQRELAKLGFSKDEILATQGAIAGLAQATGEDLATAAQLVGKTLRAFGLEASSATRVSNSLVTAVNETALNLETLATALQYVSPIASTFGISLEETNAAIGLLANNGFTASRAGTGLRQVLLTLGESGKSLAEVLEEAAENGLSVTDAVELVGKRGAPALLALIDNIDEVKRLTEEAKEPFTALVAEAKQLATTQSAFENLGVALGTLGTKIGGAISEFLDFRGLGLVLLDVFTGFGDLTAEIQALAPVVAGLNEETLDFLSAEATTQEQIAEELEKQTRAAYNRRELSHDEYALAKLAYDVTAQRLFAEKEINNAVTERQKLDKDLNKAAISSIQNKISNRDFEGAKGLLNSTDEQAKADIKRYEDEIEAYANFLEQNISEEQKTVARIAQATASQRLESAKQLRQQLLEIDLSYKAKAQVLNNSQLEDLVSDAEKRQKEIEKLFESNLEPAALKALREEYLKLGKAVEAYNSELSGRGVEGEKTGGSAKPPKEKQIPQFQTVLKLEKELLELSRRRNNGEAIDIAAQDKKLKQYKEALKIFNEEGLLDSYRDYYSELERIAELERRDRNKKSSQQRNAERQGIVGKRLDGMAGAVADGRLKPEKLSIAVEEYIDNLNTLLQDGDITFKQFQELEKQALDTADKAFEALAKGADKESKAAEKIAQQRKQILGQIGQDILKGGIQQINAKLAAEKAAIDARYRYEQDALQAQVDQGILTQEQYEAKRLELEKRRIDEENKLNKKQFIAEKINSLAQIAINTAVQASANLPLAPFIIAQGAIQAGIVAAQKFVPVQYEEGGWVNGPSHSAGGVPFTVQGQGGYEMEGGEFIVNKTAMADPAIASQVQQLNDLGRKRSVVTGRRFFADGGQVQNGTAIDVMASTLSKPIRAYVSEREQAERSNTRVRTDSRATLG